MKSGVHVVMLQKWADSAHTRFWMYEESNPTTDMEHRVASSSTCASCSARRAKNIVDG